MSRRPQQPAKSRRAARPPVRRRKRAAFRRWLGVGSPIFSHSVWAEIARHLVLTKRELQIIRGVFDDRTEFAIAGDLGISVHTVHTHVERLHHKLKVSDRVALVLCVMDEFLKLTAAPESGLPPLCGRRTAGLCHVCD